MGQIFSPTSDAEVTRAILDAYARELNEYISCDTMPSLRAALFRRGMAVRADGPGPGTCAEMVALGCCAGYRSVVVVAVRLIRCVTG